VLVLKKAKSIEKHQQLSTKSFDIKALWNLGNITIAESSIDKVIWLNVFTDLLSGKMYRSTTEVLSEYPEFRNPMC